MSASHLAATIDYLVSAFTVAATIGQAPVPVAVYDGPAASDDTAQLQLFVGLDNPGVEQDNSGQVAGSGQITWAGIGPRARYEEFVVPCAAVAWNGDSDVRAARLQVLGIVNAVDALIVPGDVDLGGNVLFVQSLSYELRQDSYDDGAVAWALLGIACKARLP